MDTVERDKDESQTEDLRRPSTPLRPVSPLQPISLINQVNESDQWTPETFYSVPIQWSAQSLAGFTDGGKSIFTDDLEMTSAAGIAGSDISISRDLTTNQAMSRPLTDLLAISCANSLSKLAGRPFGTSNQSETHRRESKRHRQLFDIDIKSTASVQGLGSTTTQQIHHGHGLTASCCYYDLNMPPQATEDANFHNENSLFAPFTPEKTIRSEKKKTDTEHLAASSNTNIKKKGNDDTGTMSIATELECNGNDVSRTISIASELECDGAPQGDKSSPFRTSSAPSKDTDKETFDGIDLNKTPGKKERRKKHRPKVINEGKSRTQKMPNPTTSKESTKPKRNRVQKKGLDKATPAKVSPGSTVQNMMEGTNSSCKKVLDFDNEGELIENGATPKEPTSLPERLTTPTMNTCPPKEILADSQEGGRNIKAQVGVDAGTGLWTAADWIEAEQAKRSKRCVTEHASGGINLDDTHRKSTILCGTSARLVPFPDIHKKRRTEKVQYPTTPRPSSPTDIISIVELGTTSSKNASKKKLRDASNCKSAQHQFGSSLEEPNRSQTYTAQSRQEIMNASHTKKRRSTAQFQNNFPLPTDYVRQNIDDLQRHNSCVEALAAEKATFIRKRRTKITSVVHSSYLKTQESPAQMFSYDPSGSPEYIWSDMLIKQFQHMDINREVEQMEQPQDVVISYRQNELVLYKREGAMVSYDGSFDPIKKRPPRPKVELDEETIRVWKLLLEDINSEGINGTNEENTKKWEEEREVFRGRANSFIARMRLVQGDRRFSPWKGSVVDSVVGVFLTQNVSDHLSSSAFMALAARFPRKSEEATSIVTDETDLSLLDSEKFMNCKERTSNKPNCDWRNIKVMNVEEDKENKAVNSSGSSRSITGERKAADDTASSENSVDTTKPQTRKDIGLCSKNSQPIDATSRLNSRINSCTSFMELLQMQEIPLQRQGFTMPYDVYSHESTNLLPKISNAVPNQSQGSKTHRHGDKISNLSECISGKNMDHLGNYQLLLNTNQGYVSQHPDVTSKENKVSAAVIKKNEDPNFMYEEHAAKVVSSAYSAAPDILLKTSVHEAPEFSVGPPGKGTIFWSESLYGDSTRFSAEFPSCKQGDSLQQHENLSYSSCNMGDITEITSTLGNSSSREQNTAEPNINMHASKITSGDTESLRSKQEASNNINAFDWDSLRKDVESNVKRRRTDSTMDSLDWEAVRTAEIHEIAETIKERGMNYKLAERIRAFLNRLVDDHGSIDLEWLRDVPPDKAKEYLLSIRGLGLKSVECVRLLTLHHLAFPVDTNVGRIAVRLGWVPLQPLPELLQIHLLELYPMLNSIQKYLWPRLCKLDQKTLYELHYQLITFGKVFCTKTKPNCNACPMRGECRHFASAFASARLALPAPEERRIVNVTENGASQQNTAATNHIPLPLPPGSEQPREIQRLEEISRPSSIEPIIEMPGTPEPEPEDGQTLETDIEDIIKTTSNNIPTINVDIEEFKQNLQSYVQLTEQQGGELSKALVALTPEAASIPTPKLKNVSRLRTEHQVYELPDSHPLLSHLDKREPDDPCSYLLSIWKPGETPDCTEPPQNTCNSQGPDNLCDDIKCFSCNSIRESISQTVRGTILVPCRTAIRGSFPLNGTYFQVNEVFADHESSYNPIIVPRDWLWNLPRCTVYFGTSVSSIFKGLDTGDIQRCFWRGYVCVRGFEQKTRAPRPLAVRFHCSINQQKRKERLDDKGQPPGSNAKPSGGQFQHITSATYEGQILVN